MKTPFTVEQFLDVFRNYNLAVFPLQIIFFVVAFTALYFAVRPSLQSGKIISCVLAFFWLWMGVVYHLIFFTAINTVAYVFGMLFVVQAWLFVTYGVFQNKLQFKFRKDLYGITGIVFFIYALLIYPVIGAINGHAYPASPTFGLPCPTTIFTFSLLLMTDKKIPFVVLAIPFLWSLLGTSAAANFGIVEDLGLLFAGVTSSLLLFLRHRQLSKRTVQQM